MIATWLTQRTMIRGRKAVWVQVELPQIGVIVAMWTARSVVPRRTRDRFNLVKKR